MSPEKPVTAVVLAAGLGKRFASATPKVLHKAAGVSLIGHVLRAIRRSGVAGRLLVVVGNGREQVVREVERTHPDAVFVDQPELLGTADAVRRCRPALEGPGTDVLILPGDGPLIRPESLKGLVETHRRERAQVTLLTARLQNPFGYGRIVRDAQGRIVKIVEEADATDQEKAIHEVSAGVWCFDKAALFDALELIDNNNSQNEYYLPDTVLVILAKGGNMYTEMAKDPAEIEGANDRVQLAMVEKQLRMRHLEALAKTGVFFEDPQTTYVDEKVEIGPDTVVRPLTFLEGATQIGRGCTIGPSVRIVDSIVEDGADVTFSVVKESHIGASANVGPFASLRPGTRLGPRAKAGTFVEIKGSIIGEGSKVPHLSYIGDTEVGRGVNLGAGTISANYDSESKQKSKITVDDGAFTGSDTTLVAPVSLGRNAGTGAGAVVIDDVAEGEIVVGVPAKPLRKRKD